jgi:hypothetical protein
MRKIAKRLVGTSLLLLVAVCAGAQIHFGIKGGLNISSVRFSDELVSAENVTGFQIGPVVEVMVPYVGVGFDAAVLYTQKGLYTNRETISTDYIDVPVNLKWKFGLPVIKGYLSAGPYVGFRVGGEELWDLPSTVKTQIETKAFSAGLNFGIGVEVFRSLQVGFNYGLGLTNDYSASKADVDLVVDGKSSLMSITAALLF